MMEMRFTFAGKPKVQKNDLEIRTRYVKGKRLNFIDHSSNMKKIRTKIAFDVHEQYKAQGYKKPIDYLCEFHFVFYCTRQHEPDIDNLPHIFCDAMQGVKIKGNFLVATTLKDDKLVRFMTTEKIVEGDKDYDGEPRTEFTVCKYRREV